MNFQVLPHVCILNKGTASYPKGEGGRVTKF